MEKRAFFEKYRPTNLVEDPLPLKVLSHKISSREMLHQTLDWSLQYLYQIQCPSHCLSPLLNMVLQEISKADLTACQENGAEYDEKEEEGKEIYYQPLKLMQAAIGKLDEICLRFKEDYEIIDEVFPSPQSIKDPHPYETSYFTFKNTRRTLEDRMVIIPQMDKAFKINSPLGYFGIFDGHNGVDAAVYCAAHLHQNVLASTHFPEDIITAIHEGFEETDKLFLKKCKLSEKIKAGTTAVVAFLTPGKIVCAWAGDSLGFLIKRNKILNIVNPHKPGRKDELKRIKEMGGEVFKIGGMWRVNGQLAVARAIGDIDYKNCVISNPDISVTDIEGDEMFLILCCDGLSDVFSSHKCAQLVIEYLHENSSDISGVSKHLVSEAKKAGSSDNITVIVVFLKSIEDILMSLDISKLEKPKDIAVEENSEEEEEDEEGEMEGDDILNYYGTPYNNTKEEIQTQGNLIEQNGNNIMFPGEGGSKPEEKGDTPEKKGEEEEHDEFDPFSSSSKEDEMRERPSNLMNEDFFGFGQPNEFNPLAPGVSGDSSGVNTFEYNLSNEDLLGGTTEACEFGGFQNLSEQPLTDHLDSDSQTPPPSTSNPFATHTPEPDQNSEKGESIRQGVDLMNTFSDGGEVYSTIENKQKIEESPYFDETKSPVTPPTTTPFNNEFQMGSEMRDEFTTENEEHAYTQDYTFQMNTDSIEEGAQHQNKNEFDLLSSQIQNLNPFAEVVNEQKEELMNEPILTPSPTKEFQENIDVIPSFEVQSNVEEIPKSPLMDAFDPPSSELEMIHLENNQIGIPPSSPDPFVVNSSTTLKSEFYQGEDSSSPLPPSESVNEEESHREFEAGLDNQMEFPPAQIEPLSVNRTLAEEESTAENIKKPDTTKTPVKKTPKPASTVKAPSTSTPPPPLGRTVVKRAPGVGITKTSSASTTAKPSAAKPLPAAPLKKPAATASLQPTKRPTTATTVGTRPPTATRPISAPRATTTPATRTTGAPLNIGPKTTASTTRTRPPTTAATTARTSPTKATASVKPTAGIAPPRTITGRPTPRQATATTTAPKASSPTKTAPIKPTVAPRTTTRPTPAMGGPSTKPPASRVTPPVSKPAMSRRPVPPSSTSSLAVGTAPKPGAIRKPGLTKPAPQKGLAPVTKTITKGPLPVKKGVVKKAEEGKLETNGTQVNGNDVEVKDNGIENRGLGEGSNHNEQGHMEDMDQLNQNQSHSEAIFE